MQKQPDASVRKIPSRGGDRSLQKQPPKTSKTKGFSHLSIPFCRSVLLTPNSCRTRYQVSLPKALTGCRNNLKNIVFILFILSERKLSALCAPFAVNSAFGVLPSRSSRVNPTASTLRRLLLRVPPAPE